MNPLFTVIIKMIKSFIPQSYPRARLLKMTSDGIYHRDQVVLSHFKDRQVPVATTIGGGYGETHEEVAQRHSIVFSAVQSVFRD